MFRFHLSRGVSALALGCALLASSQALADPALPDIDVNAQRQAGWGVGGAGGEPLPPSAMPDNVPATIATKTATQIQEQVNAMDVMEAVKYMPSIEVRERYLGDRNGILSTRTTGTTSGAESLVYADGLLLSNLLGNSYSYPPRWDMVTLPELQRVDMMYGPFSALYPGNSMGGVMTLTTRMPKTFEYHFAMRGALESFNLYGVHQSNPGGDISIAMGDRVGDFSWWVSYDHLDSFGHPMSFSTADVSIYNKATNPDGGGYTTGPAGTPKIASGYYTDIDPTSGQPRYVFGAYSIDHSLQDNGKIKLAYDITPTLKATYVVGLYGLQSNTTTQTFLTNPTTGQPMYNSPTGYVNINGVYYKLSGNDPSDASALHVMQGLTVKSDTHGPFDIEATVSSYDYMMDHSLTAQNYGISTAGQNTQLDGTGWRTADLRGIWRPTDDLVGKHEVSFGGHFDTYFLEQNVYNTGSTAVTNSTAGWDGLPNGALASASGGRTETEALYMQDVWSFLPKWKLTLGGREEFWQAMNGYIIPAPAHVAPVGGESLSSFSPKAALSWQAKEDLLLRASFGSAYRYPTVTELYQSISNSQSIVIATPNLKPEHVLSYDLTAEYAIAPNAIARLTGFREDRSNAIFSQTNYAVTPNVSETLNIGQLYAMGVEAAFAERNWVIDGLDFDGALTYANTRITEDPTNAQIIGSALPRIPHWRVRAAFTYHLDNKWAFSAGYRYSSGAITGLPTTSTGAAPIYSQITNAYGAVSEYSVLDLKVSYNIDKQTKFSLGVDNATDCKYFVSPHPYPQTTGFAELRYDY